MAADECRAGCLLITTNDDKKWQHPDTRKNLSFAELIEELRFTTQQLVERSGGNAHLAVYGLDLRPPAEK